MTEHVLVLITVGSADDARTIARRLVEGRLAAGVQTIPIESVYTWQGDTVEDSEVLLVAKTRAERFGDIEATVREIHSYEVPPIVRIDIGDANADYLTWIDDSVD